MNEHGRVRFKGRCAGCGHRMEGPQTRSKPFWTWPGELLGRYQARRAGRRLLRIAERFLA